MDWLNTANGLVALLTGLLSLVGAGVGTFFAIRNWLKLMKERNAKEVWNTIMAAADAAMEELERQEVYGGDAKRMAIEMVKKSCLAMGLDIGDFVDQLSAYIDDCIDFHNRMNAANQ